MQIITRFSASPLEIRKDKRNPRKQNPAENASRTRTHACTEGAEDLKNDAKIICAQSQDHAGRPDKNGGHVMPGSRGWALSEQRLEHAHVQDVPCHVHLDWVGQNLVRETSASKNC